VATVTVRYQVYAHELTVRTNHVDATHAFVHGPATFVHVPALRGEPVTLEVRPPPGWQLACALPQRVTDSAFGALGPVSALPSLTLRHGARGLRHA